MSSRLKPERGLRQVVRAEGEEVGVLGDRVCKEACTRQLDHRAAQVVLACNALLASDAEDDLLDDLELALVVDERHHDLETGRMAEALGHGALRTHDRSHLHLVDLRMQDREADAARAEHRVDLT